MSLNGRLNSGSSEEVMQRLGTVLDAGATKVVIDLSQLEYVSSVGLRVLIDAAKRVSRANGKLALCSLDANVREVFELAGFARLVPIFASHDEAVAHVTQ